MTYEEFKSLNDDDKYYAGCSWEGITDEMRRKEFPKLSDTWKYWAGKDWKGITNQIRIKEFHSLPDKWRYHAGINWKGLSNEIRQKAILEYIIKQENYDFYVVCPFKECPFISNTSKCILESREQTIIKYRELFGNKEVFKILI